MADKDKASDLQDIAAKLKAPFDPSDIEWRINRKGFSNGKPWTTTIPYLTSRAVQDRLDEVFGLFGWQNHIKMVTNKGFIAGISFKHDGEWVTKWDGAEGSDSNSMDLIKSGSSNALKRAAVLLGVGRYLYDLEEFFVECVIATSYRHEFGNVYRETKDKDHKNKLVAWKTPELPEWARPAIVFTPYYEKINAAENIKDLQEVFSEVWKLCTVNQNFEERDKCKFLYDSRKTAIEQKIKLAIDKDTAVISAWLEGECSGIDFVTTVAAAEKYYDRLCEKLSEKCEGTLVDQEALKNKLHTYYQSHLKLLKEGTQK